MTDQASYIFSDKYQQFDMGPDHPLRIKRLAMADELISLCGLGVPCVDVHPATHDQLARFHDRRYLETLREFSQDPVPMPFAMFGLGSKDNPIFPGLYDWCALAAGASIQTAKEVLGGTPRAFSPAGGMHHAMAARASGFCYINDINLAIMELTSRGKRVVYIDLDAHHGDGVQWAFFGSSQVLTISLHQHPETLFPGSGVLEEIGRDDGLGYNVNIPLWPHTDDDLYIRCFEELVPPLIQAYAPDVIVSQIGVDALLDDPLANLNLTTASLMRCLQAVRGLAGDAWVALGGGGYHLANVARGWTMAWAVIQGREDELPGRMPDEFIKRHGLPRDQHDLLDPPGSLRGRYYPRAVEEAHTSIDWVRRQVFPLHGIRG